MPAQGMPPTPRPCVRQPMSPMKRRRTRSVWSLVWHLIARGQADRPAPVLVAELEADRAPELDELRLGEERVQPRPQRVVRASRVERDGLGPAQRELLALRAARELGLVDAGREVREACLL